jgi:hypothetical protein
VLALAMVVTRLRRPASAGAAPPPAAGLGLPPADASPPEREAEAA